MAAFSSSTSTLILDKRSFDIYYTIEENTHKRVILVNRENIKQ